MAGTNCVCCGARGDKDYEPCYKSLVDTYKEAIDTHRRNVESQREGIIKLQKLLEHHDYMASLCSVCRGTGKHAAPSLGRVDL